MNEHTDGNERPGQQQQRVATFFTEAEMQWLVGASKLLADECDALGDLFPPTGMVLYFNTETHVGFPISMEAAKKLTRGFSFKPDTGYWLVRRAESPGRILIMTGADLLAAEQVTYGKGGAA